MGNDFRRCFWCLAGYDLIQDTLICYLEKHGKLDEMKFKNKLFETIDTYSNDLSPDYETKHVVSYKYSFDNYNFIIYDGSYLSMYKNKLLIWGNEYTVKNDTSRTMYLYGYIHPKLSPDHKSILVENKSTRMFFGPKIKLIEFDVETGQEHYIAKGCNASYSPDGRYILYHDEIYKFYYIYDRSKRSKERFDGVSVFWLNN